MNLNNPGQGFRFFWKGIEGRDLGLLSGEGSHDIANVAGDDSSVRFLAHHFDLKRFGVRIVVRPGLSDGAGDVLREALLRGLAEEKSE